MKTSIKIKLAIVILLCGLFSSCEDYLEIEAPTHKIVSKTVFSDDATALSAMQGIYNQLSSVSFSNGGFDSVTVLAGLSSDVLASIRSVNRPYEEFDKHEILPDNVRNYNLWSSAYNIIYMANSLLEGLDNSEEISNGIRNRLKGEARFVRAFTYFYLVNVYGEVPLILTTNYQDNALVKRDSEEQIYQTIVDDLEAAIGLTTEDYTSGKRTQVNKYAAIAFLGRVQLYLENWQKAENLSTQVIDQSGTYGLLPDLNQVFLAESKEAIWQFSPEGRGYSSTNTMEGSTFIFHPFLSFFNRFKLNEDFVSAYNEEDNRKMKWIKLDDRTGLYYPFKYKIRSSTEEVTESSMVLRLAEQYLIRAEARAMQNDLSGAIADLDKIRERAGLDLIADVNPEISKEELLAQILLERKKELFTEWGHRWLDIKRTGKVVNVFSSDPLWQETDVLYPIPEADRKKNPNLTQNEGY